MIASRPRRSLLEAPHAQHPSASPALAPRDVATTSARRLRQPSVTHWAAVAAVLGAGLAVALNVGKVPVALPLLRAELGLTLVQAGWVSSMLTTLSLVFAAFVGMWVGRLGALRMVLAGLAVGFFLLGLWLSPQKAIASLSLLSTPLFFALLVLRLGAVIDGWLARSPRISLLGDADLPVYSMLVPLYREPAIIPQLLTTLLRLDYPPDRLDIKILIEEDDLATLTALAGIHLPEHIDVLVAPDGLPRTTPRALNIGLIEARGALLTIYGAEDRPDPGQLRLAASLFRALPASIACLQGRLVIDNVDDSPLTRMFALEYAALFDVVNAGLMRTGLPVLPGGTSNHFRTAVLR